MRHQCHVIAIVLVTFISMDLRANDGNASAPLIDIKRGIVCVVDRPDLAMSLANESELTVFFQAADAEQATSVREAAEAAGLLGSRVFVDLGAPHIICLGDNVADAIVVSRSAADDLPDREVLRALRPRATATIGDRQLTKPVPAGVDDWSHPYHGPDNNPQSNDQLVRGNLRTQFIAEPKFSPMPEQSVVAGGRIYKAMGHIAHKENQNEMLNTLLCINAYNGTVLWKRPTPKGFMIHRNTMVATDDALLMGDHESCQVIDGLTGEVRDTYTIPKNLTDGPVWKWMAVQEGVLYGLVGNAEVEINTQRSERKGLGHWPWGMWPGHDYSDPATAFGFGRTLVAIDLESRELLWHYRDKAFLDSRATVMRNGRIYTYCPEKFLACIDATNGNIVWKNSDTDLLAAIGPNERAQHYKTGYATTCYMKCNDDSIFFAGPQRARLVSARTQDGSLAWTHPVGNLQLVLRDDAIFAAGQEGTTGVRLNYLTGAVLNEFPARRACTRATGCADSIFYRATGGTVRVMTDSNTAQHIAPMRPPCQDGVIVSNGHLYWGPWMCGCQLSLYGNLALCPAPDPARAIDVLRRTVTPGLNRVAPLGAHTDDWIAFRGDNRRSDTTQVSVANSARLQWTAKLTSGAMPTGPVTAGGLVFVADRAGVVRAFDSDGQLAWKAYTGGPIYYPPAIAHDRVFVGSADGRVYAFEAVTGRPLWSYRVGPEERRIPVFGQLISSWPVAGGVVVDNDTVYAAAGITHYDGTYVVALDAVTGRLKVENRTSGQLAEQVNDGVSLQGNLMIADGELRFLGGGVYEIARYDLETLACLNEPKNQLTSQYRTAFYPYYPEYGKYVSLDVTLGDGNVLSHDASYEGSLFSRLVLRGPLPPGTPKRDEARDFLRRRGRNVVEPKTVWEDSQNRRFTSFTVTPKHVLTTGHGPVTPDSPQLTSIRLSDGSDAWTQPLPAHAVKGGTAINRGGRIFVVTENGELHCFAAGDRG